MEVTDGSVYCRGPLCVVHSGGVRSAGDGSGQSGVTAVKQQSFENDADSDSYGQDIAIDGDTLVIADHERETSKDHAGAVLVYRRDGGSWSPTDELTLEEPTDGAHFGTDIALQGDTLLVSAVGGRDFDENSAGEVHVFRLDGGQWSRAQKVRLADREEADEFGDALALAGDTFVATAPGDRVDSEQIGAVHVFGRDGGEWGHRTKLPPIERETES